MKLDAQESLRFWSNVEKTASCWNWTPKSTCRGYGRIGIRGHRYGVHLLSYLMHKGEIPEGLLVRHTCDNRRCVNPEHLLVGTALQNTQDALDRGRPIGRPAVITLEMAEQSKELLDSGTGLNEIAKKFGVSTSTITRAVRALDELRIRFRSL